jgi:GTP cyclohydrolase I
MYTNKETHIARFLKEFNQDIYDEHLKETPKRVAKFYDEMLNQEKPKLTTFTKPENSGPIILHDLAARSLCAHHMLPFFGDCSILIEPKSKVLGLSKYQRILDYCGGFLQTQEEYTAKVAEMIDKAMEPYGVIVRLNCVHTCMSVRGVKSECASTETYAGRGDYLNHNTFILEKAHLLQK